LSIPDWNVYPDPEFDPSYPKSNWAPRTGPIAEEVKGSMCDCVGLLMAVTGSDMYPAGPPARTAWVKVGVVEAEAEPIWVGGGLRL